MFPSTYFSQVNYDMTNGSLWSSMNLHMNQCWADLSARQNLYNVPLFSFNNFSQYPVMLNNSYLLDPNYTLGQYHYNSLSNGGSGLFGWNNIPNQGGQQWSPWGFMQNNNSNGSSLTDAEREEKAKKERQYNALKDLFNAYLKANSRVSEDLKTKIETALKKSGKIEDKLAALEEAYKAAPKSGLRKAMALIDSKDSSYRKELENAGYKFGGSNSYNNTSDSEVGTTVDAIYTALNALGKDEYASDEFDGAIEYLAGASDSENNILNLISRWNDKYNKEDERSIIGLVIKKLPTKGEDRKHAIDANVKPLTEALTAKANYIREEACFEEETIEKLDKLVKDLTEATAKREMTKVKSNFEKLYVMLREMEAIRINEEMNSKYNFLNKISDDDTDFINDEIIIKETKADLKAEGLDNVRNTVENDIVVSGSDEIEEGNDDDVQATAEEQIAKLVSEGALQDSGKKTAEGQTIYEDTLVTEGSSKKEYIIKDGKIVEYKNNMAGAETSISTIRGEHNAAVEAQEEKDKMEAEKDSVVKAGRTVAKNLRGVKDKSRKTEIEHANNALNSVEFSKDNVVDFLDGMYSEKNRGYFEKAEKRRNKAEINFEQQKAMIKSILEAAEEAGIDENSKAYKRLKSLYTDYTDAENCTVDKTGKKDFNSRNRAQSSWWNFGDKATSWGTAVVGAATTVGVAIGAILVGALTWPVMILGAGVAAIALSCGKISDAEVIDDCIRDLHKEIKEKQLVKPDEQAGLAIEA